MNHLVRVVGSSSVGTTRARRYRRLGPWLMVLFACAAALTLLASPARAAELIVTNTNDTGAGSLRGAINTANTNNDSDTITFDIPNNSTITLMSGQLTIANDTGSPDLSIDGSRATNLTVSGSDKSRVFRVDSDAKAEIKGITITKGNAGEGGGVYINGTLTLANSTVSDNRTSAGDGGGIYVNSPGVLMLTDSTVSGNTASNGTGFGNGGGINSFGTLTLTSSTISGNKAGFGGAIYSNLASGKITTVKNSTISGNEGTARGGGIRNFSGPTVLENSTIANNIAPASKGGGVASRSDANTSTRVRATIISDNKRPDGTDGTDVDSGDTANPNTFQSEGSNLIGDGNATGAFTVVKNDQVGVDPQLVDLADNGGSTETHALQSGSPALDAVQATGATTAATEEPCGATEDQRGASRPQDGDGDGTAKCDVGSFEVVEAAVQLSPAAYDFGNQQEGTQSTPQSFTVENTGEASLKISSLSVAGVDQDQFSEQNDTCEGSTVKPSESCTVEVVFSPTSAGGKSAFLWVESNASSSPDEAQLMGTGTEKPTPPPDDPPPSDPPPTTKPPAPKPPVTNNPKPNNPNACTIKGNAKDNILKGTPKRDVICGFGGNDIIRGLGGNDLIKGGGGNDIIRGQGGNDRLLGGNGNDVLYGGAGRDRLLGQRGNDALFGGNGRDVLLGGPGKNVLNGGSGKDVERGGVTAIRPGSW